MDSRSQPTQAEQAIPADLAPPAFLSQLWQALESIAVWVMVLRGEELVIEEANRYCQVLFGGRLAGLRLPWLLPVGEAELPTKVREVLRTGLLATEHNVGVSVALDGMTQRRAWNFFIYPQQDPTQVPAVVMVGVDVTRAEPWRVRAPMDLDDGGPAVHDHGLVERSSVLGSARENEVLEELQATRAQLACAMKRSPHAVVIHAPGHSPVVNARAAALLGFGPRLDHALVGTDGCPVRAEDHPVHRALCAEEGAHVRGPETPGHAVHQDESDEPPCRPPARPVEVSFPMCGRAGSAARL